MFNIYAFMSRLVETRSNDAPRNDVMDICNRGISESNHDGLSNIGTEFSSIRFRLRREPRAIRVGRI